MITFICIFFFTLEPAKLNEVMRKMCVLSHTNHITWLIQTAVFMIFTVVYDENELEVTNTVSGRNI